MLWLETTVVILQSRLADAESRVTAAQDAAAATEKRAARLREATNATDAKLRSAASENSEVGSAGLPGCCQITRSTAVSVAAS